MGLQHLFGNILYFVAESLTSSSGECPAIFGVRFCIISLSTIALIVAPLHFLDCFPTTPSWKYVWMFLNAIAISIEAFFATSVLFSLFWNFLNSDGLYLTRINNCQERFTCNIGVFL